MKLPPFTLIYQSDLESSERRNLRLPAAKKGGTKKAVAKKGGAKGGARPKGSAKATAEARDVTSRAARRIRSDERLATIRKASPGLARSLTALPPKLSSTLLASSFAQEALGAETDTVAETLKPVLQDLRRGKTTVTVALWDLDARVGELPEIISLLNKSQPVFTFFDLQAPIPSGLVIQSEHFAAWAQKRLEKPVSKKEREQFQDNLMSNDFYKHARGVYKNLGVDYLVGVTQYMVAGEEDGEYFWNYFSTSSNRIILVSTYDVREFARQAGRPFEVAVGMLVIAQLLATINKKVKFHEDTGCLFDFNESRVSFINSIKEAKIEPRCLERIETKYRAAAEAMMKALRAYSREGGEQRLEAASPKDKQADSYWLKKLKSLSSKLSKELKSE